MTETRTAADMSGATSPGANPGAEPLLAVRNIEVIYNHVVLVLKGVSLAVPEGGITALLGGNGAGKSTTLKSVSNLLRSERGEVTKGSIEYRGQRIDGLSPSELVRRGVIQVMEGSAAALRENPDVKEFYLGMSEQGRRSFRDVRSYRRRKRWLN